MKTNKFRQKMNFQGKRFHIVDKYKLWFALPILIILAAAIVFTVFAVKEKSFSAGVNIGIDFTGGTVMTITIDDAEKNYTKYVADINKVLTDNGCKLGNDTLSENAIIIRYKNLHDDSGAQNKLNEKIEDDIKALYPDIFTQEESFYGIQTEFIGSAVSSELIGNAFLSVLIATILILIYILFRFEWISGVSAIIALVHDVLMILAFMVIFRVQMNSSFIAAIITIVGYSINDSIVIFDRVREDVKGAMLTKNDIHKLDIDMLTDKAVTSTLNRSVNTSLTTIFVVLMICVLGVTSIREFALPLIFGMVCGVYSSITVAPSVYCLLRKSMAKKSKAKLSSPTIITDKTEKPEVKVKRTVRVVK